MEFKDALQKTLQSNKRACSDSFFLYSCLSDFLGDNDEAKRAAEEFYRLDAKHEISRTILASAPKAKRRRRKKLVYKVKQGTAIPGKANVFFEGRSTLLHLSAECPCLNGTVIYRTNYYFARYRDYIRNQQGTLNVDWSYKAINAHKPKICRRCGNFSPTYPRGFRERFRSFLYFYIGIGNPIKRIRVDTKTMF